MTMLAESDPQLLPQGKVVAQALNFAQNWLVGNHMQFVFGVQDGLCRVPHGIFIQHTGLNQATEDPSYTASVQVSLI